jgi:hypothetical protein
MSQALEKMEVEKQSSEPSSNNPFKGKPKSRPRHRPKNGTQKAKQESFLFKKNQQYEQERFRKEDSKLLQIPKELVVTPSKNNVAVPICFYLPFLFCMKVKSHLETVLPAAPRLDNFTFLVAMRALMTAKLIQAHKMSQPPKNFTGEHLAAIPTRLVRMADSCLRNVLSPIRYIIDQIGFFDLSGLRYVPYVLRSDTNYNYEVVNGIYNSKNVSGQIGMGARRSKRSRPTEDSDGAEDEDDDPVLQAMDDRARAFYWPNNYTYPSSLPDLDHPMYRQYQEWSLSMKRFLAVHEVQIMSGVGHPSQLVRSTVRTSAMDLWSYTDSGGVDFSLAWLGLGEYYSRNRRTLPNVPYTIAASEGIVDSDVRAHEVLNSYSLSLAQV